MGGARPITLMLILWASPLWAVTPVEYAHAAIAIAQARIDLGKQQPDLPDKPPQAEAPILGDVEPPEAQGLAPDTGRTDAATEQSVEKTVLDKVPDPLEASCIVRITGEDHATFLGSGTVISASDNGSDVLTCAHIGRGVVNPIVSVDIGGKNYHAKPLRISWARDLALYQVDEHLPSISLAEDVPEPGAILTSVGLGMFKQAKLIGIDHLNVPVCLVTDALEREGRSGGGLFDHGKLTGVIKERNDGLKQSRYVALEEIKAFMKEPLSVLKKPVEPVQGTIPIVDIPDEVPEIVPPAPTPFKPMRLIMTPQGLPPISEPLPSQLVIRGWAKGCVSCDRLKRDVKTILGPLKWRIGETEDSQIQFVTIPTTQPAPSITLYQNGVVLKEWEGYQDPNMLSRELARAWTSAPVPAHPVPMSAVAGAIQAGSQTQHMFDYFRQYIGEGNQSTFTWDRNGSDSINLLSKTDWTGKALFGTNGRIQLDSPRAINLPVKTFVFDYLIRGADVTLDAGPVTIPGLADRMTISEHPQAVGAGPVGLIGIDDLLLADQIFNLVKDIASLLWPTCDLQLPDQVMANAVLNGNVVTVTFDKGPSVCIKMLFRFQLKVTSVTFTPPTDTAHGNVHVEFTGSRFIRSRDFSIQ